VGRWAPDTTLDTTSITGRVEHLVSGHTTQFRSVAVLVACMAARLQEVQQTSRGGGPQGICKINCEERR
jgi:hypothetical protein